MNMFSGYFHEKQKEYKTIFENYKGFSIIFPKILDAI